MGKTIEEFAKEKRFSNINEMIENEIANVGDIRYCKQKKVLIEKLNSLFNGEFFDGFSNCNYGNFLSRALTAYVISHDFSIPESEAVQYVTDDNHDFGIDAIYFYEDKIYIYQTKFSNSISRKDISVIKDGIFNLFDYEEKENEFNEHIKLHSEEIKYYLNKENLKIVLKIVFFGEQVSDDVVKFLNNEILENKDFGIYLDPYQVCNRKEIIEFDISPQQIDRDLLLDNFFSRMYKSKCFKKFV